MLDLLYKVIIRLLIEGHLLQMNLQHYSGSKLNHVQKDKDKELE